MNSGHNDCMKTNSSRKTKRKKKEEELRRHVGTLATLGQY
jgi:hypothetical protein